MMLGSISSVTAFEAARTETEDFWGGWIADRVDDDMLDFYHDELAENRRRDGVTRRRRSSRPFASRARKARDSRRGEDGRVVETRVDDIIDEPAAGGAPRTATASSVLFCCPRKWDGRSGRGEGGYNEELNGIGVLEVHWTTGVGEQKESWKMMVRNRLYRDVRPRRVNDGTPRRTNLRYM